MRKKFIAFLIIVLLGLNIQNGYAFANSIDNYVSIKLTNPIKSREIIKLYSDDGFNIYINSIFNDIEYIPNKNISIELNSIGEIEIKDEIGEILFSTHENNLILSSANKWDSIITVEDKRYRDFIKIQRESQSLLVINLIDIEHYLYGVVPREMPASFPMEALKAQAVAARTYTLNNLNKHGSEGYNLCDTTHCQVYGGVDGEHTRTNEAVDATKGIVITYNGSIIDAVYHSNSGGHTEDSAEAWGNYFPYLIGVEDEFSKNQPNSDWSFTIESSALNNKLKNNGIYIGDVVDLEIIETSPRGGVSKLKIVGTTGEEILNKGKIRQVLGNDELKSTWFSIKRGGPSTSISHVYAISGNSKNSQKIDPSKAISIDKNNTKSYVRNSTVMGKDKRVKLIDIYKENSNGFLIEGKGYGHGVGMSQWGAKKMAEDGYTYDEILKHYYTGVEIN